MYKLTITAIPHRQTDLKEMLRFKIKTIYVPHPV